MAGSYAQAGQAEKALGMLDAAIAQVEGSGEKIDLAEMQRLKGDILLLRDASATAEAERLLRSALDIARAQRARWWQLRTASSLARVLRDTNRRDEAHAILADTYNWFTDGFDTVDLKEAKALLDELSR
jgi:predicted ATPase